MKVAYAGGNRIEVGVSGRFEEKPRAVRLSIKPEDGEISIPPGEVELSPDLARSIAVGLIEHAAYAERRNHQRAAS